MTCWQHPAKTYGAILVVAAAILNICTDTHAQQLSASLSLQVQATVLGQATWFRRGGDFDCGFFRPARRDESMGTIQLTKNIDASLNPDFSPHSSSQVDLVHRWRGHTFVARRTGATLDLVRQEASERITITVTDFLNQGRKRFDDGGKCGHTAGSMRLASDRLRGQLRLTVLPEWPARAIAVSFERRAGLFQRVIVDGVLHPLVGSRADDLVLWVKAGESPTLTYEFDEAYGGLRSGASGTVLEVKIRSLGTSLPSLATLSSTLSGLPRRGAGKPPNATQVLTAIDVLLGAVNSDDAVSSIVGNTPWKQLFALTDELFRFEVWPLPGTAEVARDLKVAARLFGFSLGKALLQDLLTGCEPTTLSLPDGTNFGSSRVLLIDALLKFATGVLAEYPTTTTLADAEAALKAYYANRPQGFETAVEALALASAVSRTATLDRLLSETVSPLSRAAEQERLLRAGLEASISPAATVSATTLAAVASLRQAALAALSEARRVVSVDSRSVDNYGIRLFTTDAHLVRLVVGDVDPYLANVRDAYLQDDELSAEIGRVDECIKSGG